MTKLNKVFRFQKPLVVTACLIFSSFQANALVTYSNQLLGKEVEIGNLLEWSTATELDNKFFIIEKSSDGFDFEDIGTIDAAGSSDDEQKYRYLDFEKRDETSYYRLKAIDADGSASHSQVIALKKTIPNEFMVIAMTNTTTNRLFTVTLESWTEGELNYKLENYKGELIFETGQFLAYGLNELQINLEHENEGIYKLKMELKGENETLVIRKMEKAANKSNVASKN